MHRSNIFLLRSIGVLMCCILYGQVLPQQLSGSLEFKDPPASILLLVTRGGDHLVIDSAKVDREGHFNFPDQEFPPGFYQLAINDTDRVDIILDPREEEVQLGFNGTPLQEHISIANSIENQRLWEYKMVSRQAQQRLAKHRQDYANVDTTDQKEIARLEDLERKILLDKQQSLDRLIGQDTSSYFAYVVKADQRLSATIPKGASAIPQAFDWTDGKLLRSTVYSRAIMAWMQIASPELPEGAISASDSLLTWTSPNPEAWSYTRSLLIRLFDQFGPDHTYQYLVDRYVVGPEALVPPEKELIALVAEQLLVSPGAKAAEILLPIPSLGDTLLLYDIIGKNEYTVVFFYSSTCDHCHEQVPGLNDLHKQWSDKGLEIAGIALDADRSEFEATVDRLGIDWPVFSELKGWGSPAAKAFLVKATPTFFLLDRNGTIVSKPYDHQELREDLDRLFK